MSETKPHEFKQQASDWPYCLVCAETKTHSIHTDPAFVVSLERMDELEQEFIQFGDRYIIDSGGERAGHFTLMLGELRSLIALARRIDSLDRENIRLAQERKDAWRVADARVALSDAELATVIECGSRDNYFNANLMAATCPLSSVALQKLHSELLGPEGMYICATCGFQSERMTMHADGAVCPDPNDLQDICKNDGTSLRRMTMAEYASAVSRDAFDRMEEANKLRSERDEAMRTIKQNNENFAKRLSR